MPDIQEILTSCGVSIPADKVDDFNTSFAANYKTNKEFEGISSQLANANSMCETYKNDLASRDKDLTSLRTQLKDAGTDTESITNLQSQLSTLQSKYNADTKSYEKKLNDQAYEFAVKEAANGVKFSSASAKKCFISDLIANPLQIKNGELIGFNDFIEAYKKEDASAFVVEEAQEDTNKFNYSTASKGATATQQQQKPKRRLPLVW